LDAALLGRRQLDAGAARFGKTDGDRLLRRARAVLALTDLVDLLMYELARLRRGRLALARVLSCLLDGFLPRHRHSPGMIRDARREHARDVAHPPNTHRRRIDPESGSEPRQGL